MKTYTVCPKCKEKIDKNNKIIGIQEYTVGIVVKKDNKGNITDDSEMMDIDFIDAISPNDNFDVEGCEKCIGGNKEEEEDNG